jgi:hypothetical protein
VPTSVTYELALIQSSCRAVRSSKVALIQERYERLGANIDVVGIDDLVAGDLTSVLSGMTFSLARLPPLAYSEPSQAFMPSFITHHRSLDARMLRAHSMCV